MMDVIKRHTPPVIVPKLKKAGTAHLESVKERRKTNFYK